MGWGLLIESLFGWVRGRQELKKAKLEGEIHVIKQASKNVADWERVHATGSQTSWKDEFWTIVWSIPLLLCFLPEGKAIAESGFDALADMPEWYTYTLVTMVLASFGIRASNVLQSQIKKFKTNDSRE